MGFIVTSFSQKGGIGKTSYIWNMAWALSEKGNRVLICEADPVSRSISTTFSLMDKRFKQGRHPDLAIYAREMEDALVEKVAHQYDFVLIDTKGGADDDLASSAVNIADLVVSTMIPTPVNLASLEGTIRHFKNLRRWNPGVEVRFALMKINEGEKDSADALRAADSSPLPFFKTVIHQSKAVQKTLGRDGGPLWAFPRASGFVRARAEFGAMAEEVMTLCAKETRNVA